MIVLAPSTDSLEFVTSDGVTLDYQISYADHTSTGVTAASVKGQITTATTTTVLATTAAGVTRQVRGINIVNSSTSGSTIVRVQLDVSGVNTSIFQCILRSGESVNFTDGKGWHSLSSQGRTRENANPPYPEGYELPVLKVGVAPEGAGILTLAYTSALFPEAWLPGTPGAGGRAVNSEVGRLPIRVPTTGYAYIEGVNFTSNVAASWGLIDILWVNSGLSPSTTTSQNVNSVAFPARDLEETANGRGVEIGILVTTVTSNASPVTTIQMGYTNADGTGSRTATISGFPSSCVASSVIPFQLAAGDNGVRSIQTITLGTSLGAGAAISLIAYRRVATVGCYTVHSDAPASRLNWNDDGVRILSGSTILPIQQPTTTTGTTASGAIFIHDMD